MMNMKKEINRITNDLQKSFEIKNLGTPQFILGIHINYNREQCLLILSQSHYIDQVLSELGLQDCSMVATPLDPNVSLDYDDEEDHEAQSNQVMYAYSSLIRKLLRLATIAQPDISFTSNQLAQFMHNPKTQHWTAIKRVFQYLKGTRDVGLRYEGKDC